MGEQNEQNEITQPTAEKTKRDRRMKAVFLTILAIAVILVYLNQRRDTQLEKWPDDLQKALKVASYENRPVLAFFVGSPPSETTRRLLRTTLHRPENRRAVTEGRFVKVKVTLGRSLDGELAKKYKIKKLPTMVILDKNSKELNRRVGMIGEVPFRRGFLDRSEIQKP